MEIRRLKQEFRALERNKKHKNSYLASDLQSPLGHSNFCNSCNKTLGNCKCIVNFTLSEIIEVIEFYEEQDRIKRQNSKSKVPILD